VSQGELLMDIFFVQWGASTTNKMKKDAVDGLRVLGECKKLTGLLGGEKRILGHRTNDL